MLRNKSTCGFSFPLASVLAVSSLSLKCRSSSWCGDGSHDSWLQEPRSELVTLHCCVQNDAPASWMLKKERKKEMSLPALFLWSFILSVQRIILVITSLKVIEQAIFSIL